jgi:hypothetical protein
MAAAIAQNAFVAVNAVIALFVAEVDEQTWSSVVYRLAGKRGNVSIEERHRRIVMMKEFRRCRRRVEVALSEEEIRSGSIHDYSPKYLLTRRHLSAPGRQRHPPKERSLPLEVVAYICRDGPTAAKARQAAESMAARRWP